MALQPWSKGLTVPSPSPATHRHHSYLLSGLHTLVYMFLSFWVLCYYEDIIEIKQWPPRPSTLFTYPCFSTDSFVQLLTTSQLPLSLLVISGTMPFISPCCHCQNLSLLVLGFHSRVVGKASVRVRSLSEKGKGYYSFPLPQLDSRKGKLILPCDPSHTMQK